MSENVPPAQIIYADPMELEITPEPTDGERAAIEYAVAALRAASEPDTSAWWRAGVDGDPYADTESAPREV